MSAAVVLPLSMYPRLRRAQGVAPPNPQRPTTIVEFDAFRGERFGGQRGQQDRAGTALAQQRVGDLASSNQAEIAIGEVQLISWFLNPDLVAVVSVILSPPTLTRTERGVVLDELDGPDPFDHLEAELHFHSQAERSAMLGRERRPIELIGQDALLIGEQV